MKTLNGPQSGFSLIELMIVVGILSILASFAGAKYSVFQVKAKQSEAKVVMSHIATLADTYHLDNGTYVGIVGAPFRLTDDYSGSCSGDDYCTVANNMGFNMKTCRSRRYDYIFSGATATSFNVVAQEINATGCLARKPFIQIVLFKIPGG